MSQNRTLVMKFGGAAVETLEHFQRVASIVKSRRNSYHTVAVVVSAMSGATDRLISYAHAVHPKPPQREYDMLISVGERISCSLLAMALDRLEVPAVSFTGSQTGIITSENHADAKILDVKPHRLAPFLEKRNVLIVAGFQGVSRSGAITTLGRGGSDTTAVALAVALGAEKVEFFKDVSGIYTADPKKSEQAEFVPSLTYNEAMELIKTTGKVLHPRCIDLAEKNGIPLEVTSFHTWEDVEAPFTLIKDDRPRSSVPLYESSAVEGNPMRECCRC